MEVGFDLNELNLDNISNMFANMDNVFFEYLIEEHAKYMSQKELGKVFGVGESTYNAWINNKKYPDYAKIIFGLYISFEKMKSTHQESTKITKITHCLDMHDEFGLIKFNKSESGGCQAKLVARGIQDKAEAERLVGLINVGEVIAESPVKKDVKTSGDQSGDRVLIDDLCIAIETYKTKNKSTPIVKAIISIQNNAIEEATKIESLKILVERLTREDLDNIRPT